MEPCQCDCWFNSIPFLFDGIGTYALLGIGALVVFGWKKLTFKTQQGIIITFAITCFSITALVAGLWIWSQ